MYKTDLKMKLTAQAMVLQSWNAQIDTAQKLFRILGASLIFSLKVGIIA